jgi:hypothetical protein
MPAPLSCRCLFVLATALLLAAVSSGCSKIKPSAQVTSPPEQQAHAAPAKEPELDRQETEPKADCRNPTGRDEHLIQESERNRAACFQLRPGTITTKVVRQQIPAKIAKAPQPSSKKNRKTITPKNAATKKKVVRTTGRCQPQSLIYARCRTGIMTCRLGDTSPVQWFACARKSGNTTAVPVIGSVIVLDVNSRRGMPTGHPAYVEAAEKNLDNTWTLRISHTNYDRKCNLDLDADVLFDPKRMTASFTTGPWGSWAKDLKALGFILR